MLIKFKRYEKFITRRARYVLMRDAEAHISNKLRTAEEGKAHAFAGGFALGFLAAIGLVGLVISLVRGLMA